MWTVSKLRDRSLGLQSGRHSHDIKHIIQTNTNEEIGNAPDIGDERYDEWRETGLAILKLTENESINACWFMFDFAEIVITALLRQG
jgi:hypothetical protein